MSNLNSGQPEYRWERLSILESSLAHWQHIQYGFKLQNNQIAGHGTAFRNWIYWARNYKFSNYNEPELKKYDQTFNEMINFYEPQVSAVVDLSEDQLNGFIENTLQLPSGVEEIEDGSITVMGQMPDGTFKEVTITGRAKIDHRSKVLDSYSGSYDSEKLGEAYVWQEYKQYLKDSDFIKRFILSDGEKKGYKIIPGDNLSQAGEGDDDEPVHVEGSWEDCWLQLGYEIEEPHTDEDTNEEVIVVVFNSEEDIYIPVKSSVPSHKYYFAIWGYTYDVVELDAKQFEITPEGYLKLNSSGEATKKPDPIIPDPPEGEEPEKPEREWTQIKTKFEIEYEDWEKTVKEEFDSPINYASVKGFGYIEDLQTAANNPDIGSSIDPDIENIESLMPPIVCLRHDKSWIGKDWGDNWWLKNTKACKKVTADDEYYADLFDNLKEQITQGEVAWVYLIYGLPCNYTQTHYGAHYALQFFKQLTIPNWSQYKHGDIADVRGRGRSFKYGSRTFNCHYRFSLGNTHYRCGKGMCPAPGWSDIRPGEGGVVDYGGVTFWVQHQTDSWEMITISSYYTEFSAIKNGVSSSPGGADWFLPIWKEVDVERQYSKCLIPFMWTIGKNIPYTDWTNLYQFSQNVGATAYKVVKTKWYQSGLFKIILIVVVIVITVIVSYFCPPAGAAWAQAAGSALATSIGVGSTAFWTAVVVVAASVAISVVVNVLITPMLQKAFGNVIGSILGAIISIAASYFVAGGGSWGDLVDELVSPSAWLQLGNAYMTGKNQDLMELQAEAAKIARQRQITMQEAQDYLNSLKAQYGIKEQNKWKLELLRKYGATNPNALDYTTVETGQQMNERCIDGRVNAIENSLLTLEQWPELKIQTQTVPTVLFGGNEPTQVA